MSIFHLSMKPISRASGRSAVAAAAYRAADRLKNARDGMVHDFTRKSGVEHAEIVLPGDTLGADGAVVRGDGPDWARDRSELWNTAEAAEKRKDARVAREIEVALPHELSAEQRLALTREFSQALARQYGVAVDFAIHSPHGDTDIRNHHAHLLMTTRKIEAAQAAGSESGLGEKSALELENRKLVALGLPTSHEQLRDIRIDWEQRTNAHLARAGLDVRIDHRSHQECGLEIEPTQHVGVHATQMERRGLEVSRVRLDEEAARRNGALIREKPEQVLTLITNQKSVFDRRDIARALHRAVDWNEAGAEGAAAFQTAMAKVMASPALVELQTARRDGAGREIEPARYSTREMVGIERGMAASADHMAAARDYAVAPRHVDAAIARQDGAIRRLGGTGLADEQRAAIEHITGPERIASVVGLAGAGKSTMLAAAREAWEAQGYRVHGAALAGKAAEGLEESSGIAARTLASWSRGWERGFDQLGPGSVLVIDEAGMVGSKQLARFITEADRAGAKIVLVGDPEQLQPIGAGAAFRAVAERVGSIELEGIRRQRETWQRAASVDFGRHRTVEGVAAYNRRGAVRFEATGDDARGAIVRDVLADMAARPEGSRLVLAHRRVDVQALNDAIRTARQERGELGCGETGGEVVYQTTEGVRAFAPGDRVLFRENNRALGVKNGMLGTVERTEEGHLTVRLDSAAGSGSAHGSGRGRTVAVSMADYAAVDHGYATTIHKSQGATVDRAFVLASGTMDRHLTYVAMTRHRNGVTLYAGKDEFSDIGALTARLSRSQAKETTLDYGRAGAVPEMERERGAGAFGARRGIEDLERDAGQRSEAQKPAKDTAPFDPSRRAARASMPVRPSGLSPSADPSIQGPISSQNWETQAGEIPPSLPQPAESTLGAPPVRKRGMFDGLKLGTSGARPEAVPGGAMVPDDLGRAVERYARAWTDARRMEAEGLPLLEHQKLALRNTGGALDAVRAGSVLDLRLALRHDPTTWQAMTELAGPARGKALRAGIEREAQLRADPEVRAARYAARWNHLEADHDRHRDWDQGPAREVLVERLKQLAGKIQKDHSAQALMAAQPAQFGITPGFLFMQVVQGRDIGTIDVRVLSQSIGADQDIVTGRQQSRSAEDDQDMSM
ncbi:Ti-type conjugative transfer relaxase TraA [Acidiphilium acidophilum]|uniref:Ti-type conjugative transfer relaxase TraA n=1 Tax=Acidiphilium acidophilum TaxID=76588 RepID=UPI002E8E6BEC|nr:Ti-type conjugative transfer relaxase TraA [Acidiphilium acidophilum]